MTRIQPDTEQPFWKDEANPYAPPLSRNAERAQHVALGFFALYRIVWYLLIVAIFVLLAIKFPLFWVVVIFEIAVAVLVFRNYLLLMAKARGQLPAAEIQRLAKERTGADVIGSAIHTAGHPLLALNQPVVLALKGRELSVYNYNSPEPMDTIHVGDIQDVQLVTFDDERVPHANVIDNTAQAIQLAFQFRGVLITCSFRRMYKVRAIGWFQAIQAARALGSS